MYYTQEQIDRANQADLVSFLQSQGEQLTRAGNEYRWKRHDSLTVRGNKWYRHSQSKGGAPIDFVMEFYGKSFTEAVEMLTGEKGAAPPPDRPSPAPFSDFRLPPRSPDNRTARNYLTAARRIDEDVTGFFFSTGDIYEEAAHHNAVFVGRDEDGVPRYAHQRGTAGSFRLDVKGSDKAFNFCYRGEGERLFVFEAPIDLLSFLCLFKKDWQKQSYLALGGVGEKALLRFLSDRPNIKTVYLCLDNDNAGNDACSRLAEFVPEGLTVHRLVPLYKDWNEVLQHRAEIADGKYIREAIYGLKEPPQEETVEIIRMSEVDTQTVEWLWEPYIPFGKVTIVQGNPGEGKTTFALRLAAACTTGGTLPGMKPLPPFQVIYQTAEDGLGDTVKPRLMEAEADLDRVLVIDEAKRELTLSDERIEKAITQNGARLITALHLAVEGDRLPRPAVGVLGVEGFALIALSGIGVRDVQPKGAVRREDAPDLTEDAGQALYIQRRGFLPPDLPVHAVIPQCVVGRRGDAAVYGAVRQGFQHGQGVAAVNAVSLHSRTHPLEAW